MTARKSTRRSKMIIGEVTSRLERDLLNQGRRNMRKWMTDTADLYRIADLGQVDALRGIVTLLACELARTIIVTGISPEDFNKMMEFAFETVKAAGEEEEKHGTVSMRP